MAKAPSELGARYLALVKQRGHTRAKLEQFLQDQYPDERKNVQTFLREGTHASTDVRDILIHFALDVLGLDLPHCWFDPGWHPAACVDTFALQNRGYSGMIESLADTYIHLSPKAASPESREARPARRGGLQLRNEGSGFFSFRMGGADSSPFSGFVLCHDQTLFLTGFDVEEHEKAVFLVLRRLSRRLREAGVSLCGLQAGTFSYGNMPNGRAFARRIALVPEVRWNGEWNDGQAIPEVVSEWLHADGHPMTVDLIATRTDES